LGDGGTYPCRVFASVEHADRRIAVAPIVAADIRNL
jgi:hypothetical protein